MRTNILKAATSLAFGLIATSAFAHAQLEKASPPVGGTVASASEIRLMFTEGVEPKFSQGFADRPGRLCCGARRGEDGAEQPGCADRADPQTARRGSVQSSLAGRVGRHASHPGNLRIHGQALTASGEERPQIEAEWLATEKDGQ